MDQAREKSAMEIAVFEALQRASEPLTTKQLLEQIPPEALAEFEKPRQRLTYLLNNRPEFGTAARGKYVYLPRKIVGTRYRVPLTGKEFESGLLWLGAEVMFALWFREVDYHWVRPGHTTYCELPNGERSTLEVSEQRRYRPGFMGALTLGQLDDMLRLWLDEQKVEPGDSVLLELTNPDKRHCKVTLERRAEREAGRIGQRNAELADEAARVIREEVRGKSMDPMGIARWLIALGKYADPCPPDPLELLLDYDPRFIYDERGNISQAGKWEWVRGLPGGDLSTETFSQPDLWLPMPMMGGPADLGLLLAEFPFALGDKEKNEGEMPEQAEAAHHQKAEDAPEEETPDEVLEEDSEERRQPILFGELQPWLEANGMPEGGLMLAARERPQDLPEQQSARFRFRVSYPGVRGNEGTVEVKGNASLGELDNLLREPFRKEDDDDHMSGFFVKLGGDRHPATLASFDPFGGIHEGQNLELSALGLEVGG